MPCYTIENTTGRVKAFKVHGGYAEVARHATETLELSRELSDEKIAELAATGVYVMEGDVQPKADNDMEKDWDGKSGPPVAVNAFDALDDDALRALYKDQKVRRRSAKPSSSI